MSVRVVACLLVFGFLSCLGEAIITTIAKVPTKASTISVTPTPKVKVVAILEVIWHSQYGYQPYTVNVVFRKYHGLIKIRRC